MLTDASGEASIRYTPPEAGGRRTVRASINSGLLSSEVFTINGTPGSGGGGGNVVATTTPVTQPIPSPFRHRVPVVRLVTRKRLLFQSPTGVLVTSEQ